MIEMNDKDLKRFEADLKTFKSGAFPYATRHTLNTAAFETRKRYQEAIRNDLTLRNKWTTGSVRVQRATTLYVPRQEAMVGSLAEYMATQEFGGTERGGGNSKPIPTSYAAGQGYGPRPRTKMPRAWARMRSIQLRQTNGAKTRKQRNRLAVLEAAKGGRKFVYLDLGRRKGIFRITGGRRRPKVNMVWDLTRRSVHISPRPMLRPATETTQREMPGYYRDALLFQLRRHGILGYK